MKKRMIILAILLIGVITMTACSSETSNKNVEPKWSISIEVADGSALEFTDVDATKLENVEIKAVKKRKDGSETEEVWSGIKLKDILSQVGIEEYTTVIVEAGDGYSAEYTKEIADADDTILGLKKDGQELDEKYYPAQMIAASGRSNLWIRQVAKIKVIK